MPRPNTERPSCPSPGAATGRARQEIHPVSFATTLGASVDLKSEGVRRLLVNATFWGLGMEDMTPEEADVGYIGRYRPTFYGFGTHVTGIYPADLDMTVEEAARWVK